MLVTKKRIPWNKGLKGQKHSEEHKNKIRQSLLGKKRKPFSEKHRKNIGLSKIGNTNMLGKKHTQETKEKIRIKKRQTENLSYGVLHRRVEEILGKPRECENCDETNNELLYDWANISGEYKEDLGDWVRLCRPCHIRFDGIAYKAWVTKRSKYED